MVNRFTSRHDRKINQVIFKLYIFTDESTLNKNTSGAARAIAKVHLLQ